MLAASYWSLLAPAIEMASTNPTYGEVAVVDAIAPDSIHPFLEWRVCIHSISYRDLVGKPFCCWSGQANGRC